MAEVDSRLLRAALLYARAGFQIFPLRSSGDTKAPHGMLGKGGGYHLATTDETTIRGWWSQDANANIGLALAPSGLIVVDVDPKHDGFTALAALEAKNGKLDSLARQRSGSGGRHYVYLPPEGLKTAPKEIAKGVDIKFNGYIVVSPSIHPDTKQRYGWEKGFSLLDNLAFLEVVPDWCLIGASRVSTVSSGDDWTNAAMQQPVDLPDEEIERLLMLLPAREGYHEWLELGQALHHQYRGDQTGLDLWHKHSERSLSYDGSEIDRKWESFGKVEFRTSVTFRTVIQAAKEYEEKETADAVAEVRQLLRDAQAPEAIKTAAKKAKGLTLDPLQQATIVGDIQEAFKRVQGSRLGINDARRMIRHEDPAAAERPDWLDYWYFIQRDNAFYNRHSRALLSVEAFNNTFGRRLLTRAERMEGKARPEIAPADAALHLYEIPSVHGVMYLPGEDESFTIEGKNYVNGFSESSLPRMPDKLTAKDREMIRRVLGHVEHQVESQHDGLTMLAWFGHQVRTLKRVNWSLLLQGTEQDGKTFWAMLMGAMLGGSNVRVIDAVTLEHPFNDYADGGLFAVIEEIKLHGHNRYDVLNRLKPLITNKMIEIHPKGRKSFLAVNTQSFFLTTNFADAIPITNGDSRYFPIMSRWQTQEALLAFKARNPDYYARLYEVIQGGYGPAIRKWFIEEFEMPAWFDADSRAPQSASREYMIEISKSPEQQVVEEVLEESERPDISKVLLNLSLLQEAMLGHDVIVPQTRALARILLDMGFTRIGKSRGLDGKPAVFWSAEPSRFLHAGKPVPTAIRAWSEAAL